MTYIIKSRYGKIYLSGAPKGSRCGGLWTEDKGKAVDRFSFDTKDAARAYLDTTRERQKAQGMKPYQLITGAIIQA